MAFSTIIATSGTGPLRPYINWLNFAALPNQPIPITTQIFANSIPNIGNITMSVRADIAGAVISPSSSTAFNNGYVGLTGTSTAIRTAISTTVTFSNISITNFSGTPISNPYAIIIGDGEATAPPEFIRWTTQGENWVLLATLPSNAATVNSVISGANTPVLTQTGTSAFNTFITPIAGTKNPTTLSTQLVAAGAQGSNFGVLVYQIPATKSVNKGLSFVGDILTYTIAFSNVSLDTLTSINLLDTLPGSVTFEPNSIFINGVNFPSQSTPTITIPDTRSGGVNTVTFKVKVTSSNPNPVVNSAFISGFQGTFPAGVNTNSVVTTITYASLNTTKYVDKVAAQGGQQLTYTIVLTNTGNTTATTIVLKDTVPATTTFVAGTVTGATGTLPNLTVSNIGAGKTNTVTFKVLLATTPNNPILNDSTTTYQYIFNTTTGATIAAGTVSNQVSTSTASATISSMTKTVSENYGTVGDIITYTLSFTNSGNDTATNITFLDTIPNNTSFNIDTLFINNVPQTGLSPAPPGVSVQNLGSGQTTTITFNVSVTTVPTLNPIKNQGVLSYAFAANTSPNGVISNQVVTTINYSSLSSLKTVSKAYANIGDLLTYTIPISNSGNTTANNIVFLDTIPNGTSLVAGSFKQDGVAVTGSPNNGVTLPNNLKSGGVTTVTFQVTIISVPVPNPIPNTASATSSFTIDSTTTPNRVGTTSTNTNTVNTQINFASLGGITKYVDKTYATCGDSITYTIVTSNSGTVTAQNVVFKDTIPNGTVLLPTTVYVNGVQQLGANPASGVTIPNIAPGNTATLTFSVQVQC